MGVAGNVMVGIVHKDGQVYKHGGLMREIDGKREAYRHNGAHKEEQAGVQTEEVDFRTTGRHRLGRLHTQAGTYRHTQTEHTGRHAQTG